MCGPAIASLVLEKVAEELKDIDGFDNAKLNAMLSDEDIDWLITDNPNIRRIKF